MKIAITGHTNGIGKAIYDYLSPIHHVEGFSLSNGYNIDIESSRREILDKVINFDIFVNNAYTFTDNNQLNMLKEICQLWNYREDKMVINMSSQFVEDDIQYCRDKKAMNDFCDTMIYNKLHLVNLKPGLTDTRHNVNNPKPKMAVDDIVHVVKFCIENKENFRIKTVSFSK